MSNSVLEIKRTESQVVVWTPDAEAFLNEFETDQLRDALKKIAIEEEGQTLSISLCIGDLSIRNCKDYIEINITVHKGDLIERHQSILDKKHLADFADCVETASQAVFKNGN